jgi:putative transposase
MKTMKQLTLDLPNPEVRNTWGGRRPGAGRKPGCGKARRHAARPRLDGRTPVTVTLRLVRRMPNLRSERCIAVVRRVFGAAKARVGMRLVHYAIQSEHLHLIVEPQGKRSLSRGMQGLEVRLARALNRALGRRGKVFGERYHARPLSSPRQVRNALRVRAPPTPAARRQAW